MRNISSWSIRNPIPVIMLFVMLTLAGIAGFKTMLHHHAEHAPLRRNVAADEVAAAALYLCGPAAGGVRGEVLHVDGGYHVMGM